MDNSLRICTTIDTALKTGKGLLFGRNGTIELENLLTYANIGGTTRTQRLVLERNAGVFPSSQQSVLQWAQGTIQAIRNTDLLVAGWYAPLQKEEAALLERFGKRAADFLPLRSLESYYEPRPEMRWTRLLAGRRVAIVSSFANTAMRQVARCEAIWGEKADTLLPASAHFVPIPTGYAPVLARGRAEWPPGVTNWQDAVDSVVNAVVASRAEIVLIGCGGLGMILGDRLKTLGKVCIVMGGAIQVLFGIKGNRWRTHPVIGKFWNDAWVAPSAEETPAGANLIEGACYWLS